MRAPAILICTVLLVASITVAIPARPDSPRDLAIEAAIPRSGYSMAFGFGSLWMMSESRLARINPADNSVIDIDIPSGEGGMLLADGDKYRGIAIGEGGVWVPDVGNSVIYKIDPQTNAVTLTIPTFIVGSAGNIGVGAGSIWVVTFESHDKTLTRYNPDTGVQEALIPLPRPCRGVVVDFGKVWVAAASSPELYVIDPQANRVATTIAIHAPSHLLTSGIGSIWIGYDSEGLVQGVDGGLLQVKVSIETGVTDMESDGDITTSRGYIWMINRSSIVAQIDPETASLAGLYRPPTGTLMGRRISFGDGSLWISGRSVFRVKPPD
jgi:streptogramin lyase